MLFLKISTAYVRSGGVGAEIKRLAASGDLSRQPGFRRSALESELVRVSLWRINEEHL